MVIDLESSRIVWVARGKGAAALAQFWPLLRQAGAKIPAVCCDLSAAYWSAVAEHLPEAAVVSDRFHLVKLMNEKLDELRRSPSARPPGGCRPRSKAPAGCCS